MSVDLEDLRELEREVNRRFDRIELGMDIIMRAVGDIQQGACGTTFVPKKLKEEWEKWKGQKPMQWNPAVKEHE